MPDIKDGERVVVVEDAINAPERTRGKAGTVSGNPHTVERLVGHLREGQDPGPGSTDYWHEINFDELEGTEWIEAGELRPE